MGSCRIQKPTGIGIAKHGDTIIKITHNGIENEPVKYEGDKGDLYVNLECEENGGVDDFYVVGSGTLSSNRLVINSVQSGTILDLNYNDKMILDNYNATIEDLQEQINSINVGGVDTSTADNYIDFNPII